MQSLQLYNRSSAVTACSPSIVTQFLIELMLNYLTTIRSLYDKFLECFYYIINNIKCQ